MRPVFLLKPLDDKMPSRHFLEVVHEEEIDGTARNGSYYRHSLGCGSLRYDDTKSGRNRRNEPHEWWGSFLH